MIEPATPQTIARAATLLRQGKLVAFPTETVYGLGADAASDEAVARVFAAKARPVFNPLIVHVLDLAAARHIAIVGAVAEMLIAKLWPGPLTLVLPRRADSPVSLLAGAGLASLAIRAPTHPVARSLLRAFAGPLVAPSANRSGGVSPTDAAHVADDLGAEIPLILDGGAAALGIESTILDLTVEDPAILRPGAVTRDVLEELLGPLAAPSAGIIKSPGQLESHYAPRLPLRMNATSVEAHEALLAFGPHSLAGAVRTLNLSTGGDLVEAAAHLFAHLRVLDHRPARAIAVMPIPEHGLGEAINDRLRRAAAARG
jgi:L-threonylcarbamoyladenylate synthase